MDHLDKKIFSSLDLDFFLSLNLDQMFSDSGSGYISEFVFLSIDLNLIFFLV